MKAHTRKSRLAWLIGITGVVVLGVVGLALGGGVITKVYSAPAEGATYYVDDVIEYEIVLGPFDIVGQTVTDGTIDATMTCPCSAEIYVKNLKLVGNEKIVLRSSGAYSTIGAGPETSVDITAPPYNATVSTSVMATWQQLLQYTVAEGDIQPPSAFVPVRHVKASLSAFGQANAAGVIGAFTVFDQRDTHNPVLNPSTKMTVSDLPDGGYYYKGDDVTAYFHEKNDGDEALTEVYADIYVDDVWVEKKEFIGTLLPGQTWNFDYTKTDVQADGKISAIGHGKDPIGKDITFPDYEEKAEVAFKVIDPKTALSVKGVGETTVYAGEKVTVEFTEENTGDVKLTDVFVWVNTTGVDGQGTKYESLVDLEPGEKFIFEHEHTATESGTIYGFGHGKDPLGKDINFAVMESEKAEIKFKVIDPKIEIIKYVSVNDGTTWHDANTEGEAPEAPDAGAPIKWKIVVSNPNDFEMKITGLEDIFADQAVLAAYVDTVLAPKGQPGDSFEVIYDDVAPDAGMSKMNLAKVCAVDTIIGTKEVCDDDPAWVKSPEKGGPTRTVGFWGQHYEYTKHVFDEHCGGSIDLGWVTLESIDQVMAVLNFDAIVKNKGLTPDENKMLNTSRQLVAAILNECVFGTQAPMIEGVSIIDIAREKLVSGSIDEIVWIGWELDKFNNSGCDYELYGWDSHYGPTEKYWGSAKPQAARTSGAAAIQWLLTELRS